MTDKDKDEFSKLARLIMDNKIKKKRFNYRYFEKKSCFGITAGT